MLEFNSLTLRNWKNFSEGTFEIKSRTFLVGANASGKSNLLDVFRFLKDIADNGLDKAVKSRGGIKKVRSLHARGRNNYIEIIVNLADPSNKHNWLYQLQFNSAGGKNNADVNVRLEYITCNGTVICDRRYQNEDYTSRQYTHLEQPAANEKFRDLFQCFKSISFVNIIPQIIRESDTFIPSAATEDFYGRNLLETISATPIKIRTSRLNMISRILQMAVPQFADLDFVTDKKGRPHLQVKYEHFRPQGAFQQEDQFSDGTLRLIGMIWAILEGEGLMLLEEPELYLHTEIVRQLPEFISAAQKKKSGIIRQAIISSHSYDLLNTDTISVDEIVLLEPGKENTTIRSAEAVDSVKRKMSIGLTAADAVIPHVTPIGIAHGQLSLFDFE